jgi:hypothetical protein
MATFQPPDVAAALRNPTTRTVDPSTGYEFDTTSPEWKCACAPLPSFKALQWPGYATKCIEATIRGKACVIQPWLGLCQQFFSRGNYPGGVGGEVGVYALVADQQPLPDLSVLPDDIQVMFKAVHLAGGPALWWPDPDLQPAIDFTIWNTVTNTPLLYAAQETNYWVNKWMEPKSYAKYCQDMGGKVPSPRQYKMIFTVDDYTETWIPSPDEG